MNPIKTRQDLLSFLKDERDSVLQLSNEMNHDLSDKRMSLINDTRKFYQNISIGSITLLGFVSAFASIGNRNLITNHYLLAGIGFHIFLICSIALYIREFLDRDSLEMVNLQDRYLKISETKAKFAEEHMIEVATSPDDINVQEYLSTYVSRLSELPTIQDLVAENEKNNKEREGRQSGNVTLEYYGEIISFLFLFGTSLIFYALTGLKFSHINLFFFSIILFYFSFTDSMQIFTKPVFVIIHFVTRKKFFIKK